MLRRLGFGLAAVAALIAVAVVCFVLWEDSTATSVTFVNATRVPVALPDCSTGIAQIAAGQSARLPVAADHPTNCTVDGDTAGKIIGCVTLPKHLHVSSVIRLSETHPCR